MGAGLIKLISSHSHEGILDEQNPLFALTNRSMLEIAGVAEALLAIILLRAPAPASVCLVAVVASNLLFYKLLLLFESPGKPCPCLGFLHAWLGLPSESIEYAANVLLAYLLFGSWACARGCRNEFHFPDAERGRAP